MWIWFLCLFFFLGGSQSELTSPSSPVFPVFAWAVKQHRRDAERKEQERKAKAQIEFQKGSMQLPTGESGEGTRAGLGTRATHCTHFCHHLHLSSPPPPPPPPPPSFKSACSHVQLPVCLKSRFARWGAILKDHSQLGPTLASVQVACSPWACLEPSQGLWASSPT